MTIIPKWFQVTFFAIFIIGIVSSLSMHRIYSYDLEDVSNIDISNISRLSLEQRGTSNTLAIPISDWTEIQPLIVNSDSKWFTGWKGEQWIHFCTIRVHLGKDVKPYGFELATRNSMDGNVRINLARGTLSAEWLYGDYNGNALLSHLQGKYPEQCSPHTI